MNSQPRCYSDRHTDQAKQGSWVYILSNTELGDVSTARSARLTGIGSETHQVKEQGLEHGQVGRAHEASIDKCLLGGMVVLSQQDCLVFAKGTLNLVVIHGCDGGKVDGEHQGLQGPRYLVDGRAGTDDLGLECRCVVDLEQRVDIADVDLPELKHLDGWWVVASHALRCAAHDEGEAIVVVEHGIVGMVKRWALVVLVRGVIVGVAILLVTCQALRSNLIYQIKLNRLVVASQACGWLARRFGRNESVGAHL